MKPMTVLLLALSGLHLGGCAAEPSEEDLSEGADAVSSDKESSKQETRRFMGSFSVLDATGKVSPLSGATATIDDGKSKVEGTTRSDGFLMIKFANYRGKPADTVLTLTFAAGGTTESVSRKRILLVSDAALYQGSSASRVPEYVVEKKDGAWTINQR